MRHPAPPPGSNPDEQQLTFVRVRASTRRQYPHGAELLLTGDTVGRYRIVEKLGAGGMGVVYRADDLTLHRPVALKFLPPQLDADEEYRARFLREARVAARLNHPNTCTVYEVGEVRDPEDLTSADAAVHPGTPFIAMELVEGETLAERLSRAGRLGVGDALDLARQVSAGLAEAHRRQIVHRDLKPQNVMVTAEGVAKIVDFGLAKPLQPARAPGALTTTSEMLSTELGHRLVIGTCAYMSPEQASGRTVDARSDVFALGVMLYEMLSGRLPFRGDTPTETIAKIIEADPEPFPSDAIRVPPELLKVIRRCLQKKPDDRYADAGELAGALEAVHAGKAPGAIHELGARSWSKVVWLLLRGDGARRGRRLAVVGVLLAVAFGGTSYVLVGPHEGRRVLPAVVHTPGPADGPMVPADAPDAFDIGSQPSDPIPAAAPAAADDAMGTPQADETSERRAVRHEDATHVRTATIPPAALPSAPAATPSLGTLVVTSTPAFSSVTLDGRVVGVTPLTVTAPPGSRELTLTSADRLYWRGRVSLAAGQTLTVHRDLAATGALTVTSDTWVEVSVDGGPAEQTPVHFPRMPAGLHELRAFREGFVTNVLEISIQEGETTTVAVALEKR